SVHRRAARPRLHRREIFVSEPSQCGMRSAERGMWDELQARCAGSLDTPPSAIESGFRLGFAQAGDTVAVVPLAAFLEQGDSLKTFEHIALGAGCADGAETGM